MVGGCTYILVGECPIFAGINPPGNTGRAEALPQHMIQMPVVKIAEIHNDDAPYRIRGTWLPADALVVDVEVFTSPPEGNTASIRTF